MKFYLPIELHPIVESTIVVEGDLVLDRLSELNTVSGKILGVFERLYLSPTSFMSYFLSNKMSGISRWHTF